MVIALDVLVKLILIFIIRLLFVIFQMEDQLARLDLEYELQSKITSAAYKLAHDRSVSKQVRKQRKQVYHKAQTKVRSLAR